jgi:ABC-type Fe3+/spermidine/putrescine transport system ATPase subunit
VLRLDNVGVRLGNKQILRDISLNVGDGEFLALLGPSGCGKSTLLKAICGFIPLQRGHIYIDDLCLDTMPIHKRNIVMVFQDLRLFPNMSVWENVAFSQKIKNVFTDTYNQNRDVRNNL